MDDRLRLDEPRYSVKEAAAKLGISRVSLWRQVKAGRLGYYIICGRRVYGEHHLTAFLAVADRWDDRKKALKAL